MEGFGFRDARQISVLTGLRSWGKDAAKKGVYGASELFSPQL